MSDNSFDAGGLLPPGVSAAGGAPASDPRHLSQIDTADHENGLRFRDACGVAPSSGRGSPTRAGGVVGLLWTGEQIVTLRRVWHDANVPRAEIPAIVGRTLDAIQHMVRILGLSPRPVVAAPRKIWTPERDELLRSLWHTHSRHLLAEKFGCTPHAISLRAYGLRLGPSALASAKQRERNLARLARGRKVLARRVSEPVASWRTPERREILQRDWPTGRPTFEIATEMAALPGPEVKSHLMALWARDLKLRRPEVFKNKRKPIVAPKARPLPVLEAAEPPTVLVPRKCLCCRVEFQAPGRFIRMCDNCRGKSGGIG